MNTQKVSLHYLNSRLLKERDHATINKSILHELNLPNLYRFFCLSLFRSDYYNVKIRLKDLAEVTKEASKKKKGVLQNFNTDIEHIVPRKRYYVLTNHPVWEARRNCYYIPAIDFENGFITLSCKLIEVDTVPKVKGYYIKLLIIAENNIVDLSNKQIATVLKMSKNTVESYNIELFKLGLLNFRPNKVELTPGDLLLDNSFAKQKKEWNKTPSDPLPNITLKSKK